MAIERRVTRDRRPVGGKLHTARSRNDQVATDVALFTRDAAGHATRAIDALALALLDAAEAHLDWPLPGYTHLQRAQPVYLSHHLLAYVWMLLRDRERFRFAAAQTAALPLGAGALAGVNFDTDRGAVAAELGFERVAPNSIDAVSNRDFVLDYLSRRRDLRDAPQPPRRRARAVVQRGVRLRHAVGRLDLGLVDHAAEEEPRRRRAAARQGAAHRRAPRPPCTASCTRLPLTYNKDLQEDKEHLFDTVDTLDLCLASATGMIAGARFHRERMSAAASDDLIAATDVADHLVKQGVPFRSCHGIVAGLVRVAVDSGRTLGELTDEELAAASEQLDPAAFRDAARAELLAGVEGQRGRDVAGARARAARGRAQRADAAPPDVTPQPRAAAARRRAPPARARAAGRRGRRGARRLHDHPRRDAAA